MDVGAGISIGYNSTQLNWCDVNLEMNKGSAERLTGINSIVFQSL